MSVSLLPSLNIVQPPGIHFSRKCVRRSHFPADWITCLLPVLSPASRITSRRLVEHASESNFIFELCTALQWPTVTDRQYFYDIFFDWVLSLWDTYALRWQLRMILAETWLLLALCNVHCLCQRLNVFILSQMHVSRQIYLRRDISIYSICILCPLHDTC